MLSVPVFIVMVGMTVLIAGSLESIGLASLRPLLLLQFMLLAGFLAQCVAAGPYIEPNATNAILAGMLGGSAMAVQNALVQISVKGAPSTAVMTSNVTRFALDVSKVLFGGDPADMAKARNRAARTLAVIVGFAVGCRLGAAGEAALGLYVVTGAAGWPRLARVCNGICGRARRGKSLMSEAGLWASSPSVRVSGRWPHARLTSALWSATPALLFGLRLWAAVCLALYVAFWLQLDNAYWAGTSAAIAWPFAARAQQSAKLPSVGFLGPNTRSAANEWVAAFVLRLNELGWIEGRTITIEYRWVEGRTERFAEIGAEFVRLNVNVIVRVGNSCCHGKSSKNSKANRIETGERSGGIGEICSVEVDEK
jgi:Protein of unknown function (DUF1275)